MKKLSEYEEINKPNEEIVDTDGNVVQPLMDPIRKFMLCIAQGLTMDASCNYCGFSRKIVRGWLSKGEKEQEENPYAVEGEKSEERQFYERFRRAEAIFEGQMVLPIIEDAKRGGIKSAMWLLENRRSESYNRTPDTSPKESIVIINDIKDGTKRK